MDTGATIATGIMTLAALKTLFGSPSTGQPTAVGASRSAVQPYPVTTVNRQRGSHQSDWWEEHLPTTKLKPAISQFLRNHKINPGQRYWDPEKIVDEFDLLAIEYGNYMNGVYRLAHTYLMRQSLEDLAGYIGIARKKLGAKGKLQISLGARGRPGSLAHYQPWSHIININKRTFSSLGHEYAHFVDYVATGNAMKPLTGPRRSTSKQMTGWKSGPGKLMDEVLHTVYFNEDGTLTKFGKRQKGRSEYWRRRTEVWARTVEAWIINEMVESKKLNFYLQRKWDPVMPDLDVVKKLSPKIKRIFRMVLDK